MEEISLYHSQSRGAPSAHIRRGVLRMDGFVSFKASGDVPMGAKDLCTASLADAVGREERCHGPHRRKVRLRLLPEMLPMILEIFWNQLMFVVEPKSSGDAHSGVAHQLEVVGDGKGTFIKQHVMVWAQT